MNIKRKNRLTFNVTIALVLMIGVLISIIWIFIFPGARVGPFGIGLPAPMQYFKGKYQGFEIQVPESWVISETPQGNHGDNDIFAVIAVPGRGYPFVSMASKEFTENDLNQVAAWGEIRILEKSSNYQQLRLDGFHTDYLEGLLHEYQKFGVEGMPGKVTIQCLDFYYLKNQMGYSISFCAEQSDWDDVKPVFQQMIESLITY